MGKSRCVVRWSREAKKKIRNLIMRDHGYLVSKGEGGLLSDYHCHAAVVALQNTTYTHVHRRIEEKTAEKSDNKSI